jgi:prepilin-type N-terminal cleavage/methylation domain-containing protein
MRGGGIEMRRKHAFTFVELMISILIVSIVGGAAVSAMWYMLRGYTQMDDYSSAEFEIEYAFQRLGPDFVMIGLGMPNNRKGLDTFAKTFSGANPAQRPIMALLGDPKASTDVGYDGFWGGPATVAAGTVGNYTEVQIASRDADGAYLGPELYYTFGVPTGLKGKFTGNKGGVSVETADNDTTLAMTFFSIPSTSHAANPKEHLEQLRHDGRNVGLQYSNLGRNTRSWVLFPTLRLPALFESWTGDSNMDVTVVPAPTSEVNVRGTIMGLDEIHLVQTMRLYRNSRGELVRVIFGEDYTNSAGRVEEVLARNIVALQFLYNPSTRLLTVYMAARGQEVEWAGASGRQIAGWPSKLPPLSSSDTRYRIVTKNLSWRVRN